MKILWLCNIPPGKINKSLTGSIGRGGLWMDHVLCQFEMSKSYVINVVCPFSSKKSGKITDSLFYNTFVEKSAYKYDEKIASYFLTILKEYNPDIIHIWGTEFPHTLAMINGCKETGRLVRTIISIQGLCSVYSRHYFEGLPNDLIYQYTFRDFIKHDSLNNQKTKFMKKGNFEIEAIKKSKNAIGRTNWDFVCTKQINPKIQYFHCNETLREEFYSNQWEFNKCDKDSIFVSNFGYPIKGFHYVLEAINMLKEKYPSIRVRVPGKNLLKMSIMDRMKITKYHLYLRNYIVDNNLEKNIEFLGSLSAEEMKQNYLKCNVFVLPSTIENSPNSLGEAMLLGVPIVASDVGGVSNMLEDKKEGYIYPSTEPYMMSYYIEKILNADNLSFVLNAKKHAEVTHDSEKNYQQLISIYATLLNGETK